MTIQNWNNFFEKEFKKSYFKKLLNVLKKKYKNSICYPEKKNILSAFKKCQYKDLKVVILGQDPYYGHGEADGLSFSVNNKKKIPPSLRNIFIEIKNEYSDFIIPKNGNLSNWAKQGVLLLNKILTVEYKKPKSHKNIGWETFTENIIKHISLKKTKIVFLLWGVEAKSVKNLINKKNHYVLESSHPSPFSVNMGFFGNNHFIKTNNFLEKNKIKKIKW